MSACEVCWDLAYARAQVYGGSQADHYRDLLVENEQEHTDHPPKPNSTTSAPKRVRSTFTGVLGSERNTP